MQYHENVTINPGAVPVSPTRHLPAPAPGIATAPKFTVPFNTVLEYAGAALGIIGWLGVRQIGSPAAQQLGFLLWIFGALILVAWGWHTRSRGIMAINAVNAAMAASALAGIA